MASRRLRIKPVANVPVRRGRATEDIEKVEEKTEQPKEIKLKEESSLITNNELAHSSDKLFEQNDEQNNDQAADDHQGSVASCKDKIFQDEQDQNNTKSNPQIGVAKPWAPPGLARKRVKPAINILAISRPTKSQNANVSVANKEDKVNEEEAGISLVLPENHVSDLQNSDCPASTANVKVSISSQNQENKPTSDAVDVRTQDIDKVFDAEDKEDTTVENRPTRTHLRPSLDSGILGETSRMQNIDCSADKENNIKDQKPARRHLKPNVNISAISRLSRQQKCDNMTVTLDKEKSYEEPRNMNFRIPGITQLTAKVEPKYNEKPLSIGANLHNYSELQIHTTSVCGENTNSPSKPTVSWSKSRFTKPVPQIKVARCRRTSAVGGGTSNSESEDDSSKKSSLQHVQPGIQTVVCVIESDDDHQSMSEASTVSPPLKMARHIPSVLSRQSRGYATESEDEVNSKKSICSASTITPPCRRLLEVCKEEKEEKIEKKSTKPRILSTSIIKFRKARREFYSKFNGATIDRSRLTMMDLIFYNPVTNPMKSSEAKGSESSEQQPAETASKAKEEMEERLVEEQADEPESEREGIAMPVPQVKVGPDGQIVLDERSLVIETTGAKKSRDDLANSAVIVDTGTTGNGFYSRKFTRIKEWSRQETLKFYRALNIIGTDFLVMQSIFPKRTRRDLKMKFKREERINRLLVEKALRNPQDFDLTELEKELAKEEAEEKRKEEEKERLKSEKLKKANEKTRKSSQIKRSFLSRCMDKEDTGKMYKKKKIKGKTNRKCMKKPEMSSESDEENEVNHNYYELPRREESQKNGIVGNTSAEAEIFPTETTAKTQNNNNIDNEEDEDEIDEEEDEIRKELQFLNRPPRPTRSGRVPQPKRPLTVTLPASKPVPKQCKLTIPLKDLSNVEPGSLLVIATQSPTNPGHQIYKVFMVAPPVQTESASAVAPVALSPKLMQSNTEMHAESNVQLYNNETLSFTSSSAQQTISTSSQLPAVQPRDTSDPDILPSSSASINLHTFTSLSQASQMQRPLEKQVVTQDSESLRLHSPKGPMTSSESQMHSAVNSE